MLSFKSGQLIAELEIFDGKKKLHKQIFVKDDDGSESEIKQIDLSSLIPKSFYTSMRNVNSQNMILFKKAIKENNKKYLNNNFNLEQYFETAMDLVKEIKKKVLIIPKEVKHTLFPVPMAESSRSYIGGPAGCGKSTWIAHYLKEYNKKYKKNDIYVFSPKLHDVAFEGKKLDYVKIDSTILENPLNVKEFYNSICIFDDIESITDKNLYAAVETFMKECYQIGRHPYNISVICVSHILLNGNRTKVQINESDYITMFPSCNFAPCEALCRRYLGFSKDQLSYIKNVNSRWVSIKKSFPQLIISQNEIKIL